MTQHPGNYVRGILVASGIIFVVGPNRNRTASIAAVADKLGVTRPALSRVLNKHSAVSPTMALLLEKHYGFDAKDLVIRQALYDLDKTRNEI